MVDRGARHLSSIATTHTARKKHASPMLFIASMSNSHLRLLRRRSDEDGSRHSLTPQGAFYFLGDAADAAAARNAPSVSLADHSERAAVPRL